MADYYLKPPKKQSFYCIFAIILNILGLGNNVWWGYKPINSFLQFHGKFVTTMAPVCSITQLLYTYIHFNNLSFDVIGTVLSILPVSILVNINIRSAQMKVYKKVMKAFMTKIHISNYSKNCNDYNMKQKIIRLERVTRFTAFYLIFCFGLNWLFWISIPVIHNIAHKEKIINKTMQLQTCVYMWMPFDYAYSFGNWIIIHVINVYVVFNGVIVMATLHCLNYIFIYHLIGHLQILKETIKSSFVSDISDEEVKRRLTTIVKHHAFIIRVFDEVQSAFGVNVAANYLHNLFSDSLILYQVLNGGDILSYGVMICAYMGELILMSFVIEEIRRQSEDLPGIVYCIPWEKMTIPNQRTVLFILSRVQTRMQFVALGSLRAGVQPMVSILKTTFSYYVILKEVTGIESE